MRILWAAPPILFLASPAIAQEKHYTVNCGKLESPSPGCKSYNDMVTKNDSDVLSQVTADESFVCFRPADDVFFVLSYRFPGPAAFTIKTAGEVNQARGLIFYGRFKEGQREESKLAVGTWLSDTGMFMAAPKTGPSATVIESEITYSYDYQNVKNNTIYYTLRIRKSTLRFAENFSWIEPGKPKTV